MTHDEGPDPGIFIAEGTDPDGRPFHYRPITVIELIDALAWCGPTLSVIHTKMGPERLGFVSCLRVVARDQQWVIPLEIDEEAVHQTGTPFVSAGK